MKRLCSLFFAVVLCWMALAGCAGKTEQNIKFEASVESVQDQSILVTTSDDVGFDQAQVRFSDQLELQFAPEPGQTVEITILPEIAESYPVQVTAVDIRLIAQPTTVSGFPISRVRTHQLAEASLGFLADYCDNAETFVISRELHLPAMRFENKSDISDFIEAGRDIFDFEAAYNGPSFADKAELYSDDFFVANVLVAIYIVEGSGSVTHEVESIECQQGVMRIVVERQIPDIGTTDMAYWFILLEIPRSEMSACSRVDAVALNP